MLALHWDDFQSKLRTSWSELYETREFADVTLFSGFSQVEAHKVVLASSSPTLHALLRKMNQQSQQNPAIFFPGINFADLANLVTFMYIGEVEVAEDRLDSFLKAAAELQVKGLVSGDQASGGAAKVHGSNGDVAKDHAEALSPTRMDDPSSAEVLERKEDVIVGGKTETGEFLGELKLGVGSGRTGEGGTQKSQRAKKKRKGAADGLSIKNVGDFEEIHNIENIDPNANSEKSIDSAQLNSDLKKMYNKLRINRYQCLLCEKVMKKSDAVMKHIETHLDLIHPCSLCPSQKKTRSALAFHYNDRHGLGYINPFHL